ncbi:aspartate/glutamate racemase family protein [Phenylobacterium sp. 20VBR1]|uniref:Aspartate/glutamate racemase family protein n=2 Tax=Phenylobacterium glaciei TaxID=2803784 RepID=A0A941CZC0_9CAUL|nr:aspartate/glutamate racemase family protein [Phenylobacterium glaciei]MBR7619385.1 aspartate/glutamate racemase family protein [Phenylobacterium glaciei]
MKTLGLLGGMSAESTTLYYAELNRLVRERLGGLHSAQLLLWSVDFAGIAALQAAGDWDQAGAVLADAAKQLEGAGAQAILICANTMHLVADQVQAAVSVPVIHIADATANAVKAAGCSRPLLLATKFTMEKDFYRGRLAAQGVEAVVPEQADRDRLHAIIYDELCQGVISAASKAEVLAMIAKAGDADCVIFGCTEIGLLLAPGDVTAPVVDTALVHARAGVDFALG